MATARVLQIARMPALVLLLLAAGLPQGRLAAARVDGAEVASSWLMMVGFAIAFVAVAVAGRQSRHPRSMLAVEGLVAAILGLAPPVFWGVMLPIGRFMDALGGTTGNAFVQALGITWLVLVIVTAVRQARVRESVSSPAGASSGHPR